MTLNCIQRFMPGPGTPHPEAKELVGFSWRLFCRVTHVLVVGGLVVLAHPAPAHGAPAMTPANPAPAAPVQTADFAAFQKTIQPFFTAHCVDCHGDKDAEAGVRLDNITSEAALTKNLPTLEKALKMLAARKMPPKGEERPTEDEYHTVTTWIEGYANRLYMTGPIDPGRVTLHRLNRAEYNNTIHDLLAIDFNPADAFPVDDAGYGFDNNGDVLSIAPILFEKYITAASLSLKKAVFAQPIKPPPVQHIEGATAEGDFPKSDPAAVANNQNRSGGRAKPNPIGRVFNYYGNIYGDFDFPVEGDYVLSFRGYGVQGNDGPAKAQFYIDTDTVGNSPISINNNVDNARVFSVPAHITAGPHRIYISFRSNTTKEQYLEALSRPPPTPAPAPMPAAAPASPAAIAVDIPAAPAANGAAETSAPATVAPSTSAPVAAVAVAQDAPPVANAAVSAPGADVKGADVSAQPAPIAAAGTPGLAQDGPPAARGTPPPANRGGRPPTPKSITGNATMAVIYMEVEGPLAPTPDRMPESYHRVMVAQPSDTVTKAQAAEKIIRNFATKAFRRPVKEEEVADLMGLWTSVDADGRPLEESVTVALQAVLASPNFLFRVEQDPQPGEAGNVHQLNDYELASRLSYFLWSSMPDDELFAVAEKGQLRANLDAQIDRMLKSPKAEALVQNFAGQWLRLRQVDNVSPEPHLYPQFDAELRESMLKETQLFFSSIKDEDRNVLDFINADYSFVNGRLAKFYGIDGITGDEFQRVTFPPDSPRGGIITQASILTITSYNSRTSPVQRGKWVLENLLDSAPPPPPPNVPVLDSEKQLTGTLRQQMEQHRANPTCAACHERMDAIGFSLENFDAIGGWRNKDANDVVIDPSGSLPDGKTFSGARELKQILLLQKDQFYHCMADKMLIYALGRGTEPSDRRTIDKIAADLQQGGGKFSALVKAIAHSDAFQKRRGTTAARDIAQTSETSSLLPKS